MPNQSGERFGRVCRERLLEDLRWLGIGWQEGPRKVIPAIGERACLERAAQQSGAIRLTNFQVQVAAPPLVNTARRFR